MILGVVLSIEHAVSFLLLTKWGWVVRQNVGGHRPLQHAEYAAHELSDPAVNNMSHPSSAQSSCCVRHTREP